MEQKKQNIHIVILSLTQDLQRLPLLFINNLRGRFQIKFGMTSLCNSGAFTLIELLVVVLIIGILAAVAVPQYQKAVDKARFTELITLVKHIKDMQEVYYLANGQYAADCEELGIDIPGGYELNADNRLIETNKKYLIGCSWGGNRVSAQMRTNINDVGTNLVAYESRFNHVETNPGQQDCWANGEDRYNKLCQSVCGTAIEETLNNQGQPNGFSCSF